MKTKFWIFLTLAAFFNPISVMAIEKKKISDLNPLSIKCFKDAKKDWLNDNKDDENAKTTLDNIIKDAKKAVKAT